MDAHERGLGLLVVGAGRSGTRRAVAALVARGVRPSAVVDPSDPDAALELAERLGAAAEFDLREALRRADVEAVVVATPSGFRAEVVREALAAGRHVLSESPVGSGPDEALALAAEADARGVRLGVGFPRRFDPPVRDALKLLSRWAVGRTLSVRVEAGPDPDSAAADPDLDIEHGGDALDAFGPSACDLIRRFLGEVVAAKGYLRERRGVGLGPGREALGLFRDHDCGLAELRACWAGGGRAGLFVEVVGSEATIRVETAPWRLTLLPVGGAPRRRVYRAEQLRERLFRRWHGCDRSTVAELEAFAQAVAAGRPRAGAATGWDGARALQMVEAVRRSDWSGEEVELEPPADTSPSGLRRRASRRTA